MDDHPNDLDRALERHGIPAGNVRRLLHAAAGVFTAWEAAESREAWAAWSRSDAASDLMADLEAALETFASREAET